MDTIMDIFSDDAFSFVSLTESVNRIPFVPGQAGLAVNWDLKGVSTLSVAIELRNRKLQMLQPLPRGGPGQSFDKNRDKILDIRIPHYQVDDAVSADEVQGRRAFGSANVTVGSVLDYLNERAMETVNLRFNPTMEYQRIGALQGIVLNWDGSVLINLYDAFGVTQPSAISLHLSDSPGVGNTRQAGAQIKRAIANALGGIPFTGVTALVGPTFFDALIKSDEARKTFLNQQEARDLRGGYAFSTFDFGDVHYEEYRGMAEDANGDVTPFIPDDGGIAFPTGVAANIYRTVFAPADYNDTVNTVGLPRYRKVYPFQNDKGMHDEQQSNTLAFCTYPDVLIPLTIG